MKRAPLLVMLVATSMLGPSPCDAQSTAGGAATSFKWSKSRNLKIPLRDGVRLSADLHVPRGRKEPVPCVLTMTPYTAETYAERGVYFASRGLAFLAVDARGTGRSGGKFAPFIQEAADSHDAIEWLAAQPYCNGKVGMWGGSYAGYAQWAAAKERPPHLATIVPAAAPYAGIDFPTSGHLLPPYALQWLVYTDRRQGPKDEKYQDPEFWVRSFRQWFESGSSLRALQDTVGFSSPIFQQWLAHPASDAYWDEYNPTAQEYAALSIPVLSITGSYDGDQRGSLAHYRRHLQHASPAMRQRHFLVMGPWDHAGTRTPASEFRGIKVGPASLVDLPKLHLDWYAWTMGAGARPELLRNNVAYYVMQADEWRYADSIESATGSVMSLFLDSAGKPTDFANAGTLSREPANAGADSYLYDPRDVSTAALDADTDPESLTDQRLVVAGHGKHLVYQTVPFAEDTEITGFFELSAWIALDQPDTDFSAGIYEVAADGSSTLLSNDVMRARYRESPRRPKLVDAQAPLRYDFSNFSFISRLIQKGSYLRLIIGPNNSIYSNRNFNSGGDVVSESMKDARSVNVVVHHSREYPTVLKVPLGQPRSLP